MAVYFARAETTSFVKIGFATSVARRLMHLQSGCPYRLKLVREVEGDRYTEAAYHRLFAEHHVDRDWFYWSPSMATEGVTARAPIVGAGTFADLIDEMGGPVVVATRLGVPNPVVYKYRQRNRIPAWQWPALQQIGVPADRLIACEVARASSGQEAA